MYWFFLAKSVIRVDVPVSPSFSYITCGFYASHQNICVVILSTINSQPLINSQLTITFTIQPKTFNFIVNFVLFESCFHCVNSKSPDIGRRVLLSKCGNPSHLTSFPPGNPEKMGPVPMTWNPGPYDLVSRPKKFAV